MNSSHHLAATSPVRFSAWNCWQASTRERPHSNSWPLVRRASTSNRSLLPGRAPDHGRLRPWRFVVLEGDARRRLGDAMAAMLLAKMPEATQDQLDKERNKPLRAPTIIVVAAHPVRCKIPDSRTGACGRSGDAEHAAGSTCAGIWRDVENGCGVQRCRRQEPLRSCCRRHYRRVAVSGHDCDSGPTGSGACRLTRAMAVRMMRTGNPQFSNYHNY